MAAVDQVLREDRPAGVDGVGPHPLDDLIQLLGIAQRRHPANPRRDRPQLREIFDRLIHHRPIGLRRAGSGHQPRPRVRCPWRRHTARLAGLPRQGTRQAWGPASRGTADRTTSRRRAASPPTRSGRGPARGRRSSGSGSRHGAARGGRRGSCARRTRRGPPRGRSPSPAPAACSRARTARLRDDARPAEDGRRAGSRRGSPGRPPRQDVLGAVGLEPIDARRDHAVPHFGPIVAAEHLRLDLDPPPMEGAAGLGRDVRRVDLDGRRPHLFDPAVDAEPRTPLRHHGQVLGRRRPDRRSTSGRS